jgi:hypothetical protein
MNAGQGFRRAPGSPLRAAAGTGAAALIATAVSTARRAGTARADRDSGPAQGSQVPPSAVPVSRPRSGATGPGTASGSLATVTPQATRGVSPSPAPEAIRACGLAAGQVATSAALFLFTVTALPAIVGRRRAGGKRGAAHARTPGRQAESGDDALPPEIPADVGDPWAINAPRSGRPDPVRHDAQRSQHADDYPSWPGRPGPYALHPDHPSWGGGRTEPRWDATEQALREDGYPSWPEPSAPPWRGVEPPAANDGSGWRGGGRPARHESLPAPYRGPHGRSATGQSATGPGSVLPAPAGTDLGPRVGFAPRASSAAGPGVHPYPAIDSRADSAHPGDFGPGPGRIHQAGYAPGPGPAYAPGSGPAPRAGYAPQGFAARPGYGPGPGSASRTGFVPRHGPVLQPGVTGVMEGVRSGAVRVLEVNGGQSSQGLVWDTGSVELATRIISEANQQAAEIRHEARDDAATARADARQEAAKLVQQATDQAAATLAEAELQAAKIRAEILKLSADLGGVATSFTESLLSPAKPAAKPVADPLVQPATPAVAGVATPPATEPAARLAAGPAAKPDTKPATRSASVPRPGVSPRRMKPEIRDAGKPKNRQASAARKVTIAFVALSLAGAATGATELVLHGPAFFVFRANGAGASQTGPEEDQGPGQPNAPGAHHHAKVIPARGQPVKPVPHKTEKPK